MRRFALVPVLVAVFQLMTPRPALAIWGVLERLSGPGPFNGPEIDVRVACFDFTPDGPKVTLAPPFIETRCPIQVQGDKPVKPRFSVDINIRDFSASGKPEFAGNQEIHLKTVVPSFTWSVFGATSYDVLDVMAGAGPYWFSSSGFDTFSGLVVDLQADFHFPYTYGLSVVDVQGPRGTIKVAKTERVAGLLQAFSVRVSAVAFPHGFDTAAVFKATGSGVETISGGRFVPSAGVYVNFEALRRAFQ